MANEFNTDTKREAGQPKADTGRYMRCMAYGCQCAASVSFGTSGLCSFHHACEETLAWPEVTRIIATPEVVEFRKALYVLANYKTMHRDTASVDVEAACEDAYNKARVIRIPRGHRAARDALRLGRQALHRAAGSSRIPALAIPRRVCRPVGDEKNLRRPLHGAGRSGKDAAEH